MAKKHPEALSRREREILDILYRLDSATASEVRAELAEPPSYSSVRALLRVMEDKEYVVHSRSGRAYIYSPTTSRARARRHALAHLVRTFFDNSVPDAVATLVSLREASLSDEELRELEGMVAERRRQRKERDQ